MELLKKVKGIFFPPNTGYEGHTVDDVFTQGSFHLKGHFRFFSPLYLITLKFGATSEVFLSPGTT